MASELRNFWRKMLNRREKRSKLEVAEQSWLPPSPSTASSSSEGRDSNYSGEIERVFRYIDEDGDGKISPSELRRCVKAVGVQRLTEEEAEAAVRSSDSDGDGLLSLIDFERLMGGDGVSEEEKTAELREAFAMYSDDRKGKSVSESGCITPKSLKRMLSRLGESKSIKDCKAMIRVYDVNGDGVLTFDEFAVMMR